MSSRHLCKTICKLAIGTYNSKFLSSSCDSDTMTLTRKIVNTNNAPRPVGPYSQGVILDSTLYVSGCLGLDKDTMKLVDGDVANEAKQALKNLGHILQEAGTSYDKVIKTTVFLGDINDFATVNEVYKDFFVKDYPARSAIQVGKLPLNARVEIEAIAAIGTIKTVCCGKH